MASWVEPITDFDDAWSLRMKAGVEYRINLSPARGRCIALALFAPGTRSFAGASPLQLLPCGGYLTYTRGFGGSGRYSLLVTASDQRPGRQRYHLEAAVAGPDDAAPGLLLRNLQTPTGTLAGTRIDVVDLYRFRVDARSDVTLTLRGPASARLLVLNENGRRIRLYRLYLRGNGRTGISWRPPAIGHWRVRASFGGTRTASPSDGGTARLVVSG